MNAAQSVAQDQVVVAQPSEQQPSIPQSIEEPLQQPPLPPHLEPPLPPQSQTPPLNIPQIQNDEISQYIVNAFKNKAPRSPIIKALVAAGHNKKDVQKRMAEIDAVNKKLKKDIKAYFKAEKKSGKNKKEIKQDLIASGVDENIVNDVL